MMDNTIKEKLLNYDATLKIVVKFMEDSGIDYKDRTLRGPVGMATFNCIYLDVNKLLLRFNSRMVKYIVLHEIAHYKRIQKMGKGRMIYMLSLPDFDEFCKHIIGEEIFADRYACLIYLSLYKEVFPRCLTQQLDLDDNKKDYKSVARQLFGIIDNKEEEYIKLLETFIV